MKSFPLKRQGEKRYAEWCKDNNEKPLSGCRLGEYLAENGIAKRLSNGTWYSGIILK